MNIRTATIWTTAAMLITMIIVPPVCVLVVEGWPGNYPSTFMMICGVLYGMFMLWLLSGSPTLVTFIIARKLEFDIPALVLLAATVAYGILFVYSQCMFFIHSGSDMRVFFLLTPLASLYWMIPAWIAAWILNSRYLKTPTEPDA